MHGLLRRLFAPRWQHPEPEVRRKALAQLDPQQPEQHQALEALTRDPQSDIQLAALLALDDVQGLVSGYAQRTDEEAWFNAACQRLSGKEGNTDLRKRQALVSELTDPRLLKAIAFQGDNLDLRLEALSQLSDEDDLVEQACHNKVATVRHQAAQRLEHEESLKRLLKEARSDRSVMRLARERLTQRRNDAEWLAAQAAQREQLLKQLEQHAKAPWEPLYRARFRHLEREWEGLSQPPSAEQEQRFHQAILSCRKTLHDHDTQQQARQERLDRRAEADATREQLLDGLEETLESLKNASHLTVQDTDSLRAQRQLLGQRWQSLSDLHAPNETAQQRYTKALAEYDRFMEAWQRWCDIATPLEEALSTQDAGRLKDLTAQCHWPGEFAKPELLNRAHARLSASEHDKPAAQGPDLETLTAELDNFEHLLERGAFKSASHLHQRLKPALKALDGPAAKPLKARLKHLGARLAELRDWRGYVAGPKREQLCESIEALASDQHMTESALDRHHRQLVKEWKALGDAAANREQSARFRAASDQIHERLAPWRAQLDSQRDENLRLREELCEQLETLLEQPSQQADPDVLREIRDKARHQWRHYTPVPREQSEAIGRRFGKIRQRLQSLIDQRAEQIAQQKRELINQVEALQDDSEQPLAKRIAQTKQLQQHWRKMGRAPKGEEQALYKRFRRACDQLFAQRAAHKQEQASREQKQLEGMQALIDEMDGWQPESASDKAILDGYLERVAKLEPLPRSRRGEGMQRRLNGIVHARRERLEKLTLMDTVQRWHRLMPLINAHLAADQRVLAGEPAEEVDAHAHEAPVTQAAAAAHQQRNQARLAAQPPLSSDQYAALEERLARLRVHLSLLTVGSVKQRDEPLRLAIQVERLNEGIGSERTQNEELISVMAGLLALGPMPQTLWEQEVEELDALLTRLARPL